MDGGFNNASIRKELDTKYLSVMKKSNPIDVIFKDKAQFDVQNPMVGSLIAQVQQNKAKERAYLKQLSQAPSIRDINIGRRLRELKDFNEGRVGDYRNNDDDNHDEDGPPCIPPTSPAPPTSFCGRSSGIFPTPPNTPAGDDDGTDLAPTQRFLLQKLRSGGDQVAKAIGQEISRTIPQRVTFSDNITRVFPQAQKIMEKPNDIEKTEEDAGTAKIRNVVKELNRGKELQSLKFYSDGVERVELMAFARCRIGFLSQKNENFIKYLTSPPYGPQILAKYNIKIHIEIGMFYVDNRTTGESLYNFLQTQQDTSKKLLRVKLNIDGDLTYYFNEILSNIEKDADDLQTNSISKFFFYNFNMFRVSSGKNPLLLRHSQTSDDEYALEKLPNKSWSYFVESLTEISNDDVKYGEAIKNEAESNIIEKTVDNLDYCKDTYNQAFTDTAIHFKTVQEHMQRRDVEKIQDENSETKVYRVTDIADNSNITEVLRLFSQYFFKTAPFLPEKI